MILFKSQLWFWFVKNINILNNNIYIGSQNISIDHKFIGWLYFSVADVHSLPILLLLVFAIPYLGYGSYFVVQILVLNTKCSLCQEVELELLGKAWWLLYWYFKSVGCLKDIIQNGGTSNLHAHSKVWHLNINAKKKQKRASENMEQGEMDQDIVLHLLSWSRRRKRGINSESYLPAQFIFNDNDTPISGRTSGWYISIFVLTSTMSSLSSE